MALEIERKFLLANDEWRKVTISETVIKQGYLSSNKERVVRIRLKGDKSYLTIKGKNVNTVRLEFEYEIPYPDGVELLQLCERPIIEKTRYEAVYAGNTWEIDEFKGDNDGLIVAEIELEAEDQVFNKPSWIGEEVSSDVRYYNANLIKQPYKSW